MAAGTVERSAAVTLSWVVASPIRLLRVTVPCVRSTSPVRPELSLTARLLPASEALPVTPVAGGKVSR